MNISKQNLFSNKTTRDVEKVSDEFKNELGKINDKPKDHPNNMFWEEQEKNEKQASICPVCKQKRNIPERLDIDEKMKNLSSPKF